MHHISFHAYIFSKHIGSLCINVQINLLIKIDNIISDLFINHCTFVFACTNACTILKNYRSSCLPMQVVLGTGVCHIQEDCQVIISSNIPTSYLPLSAPAGITLSTYTGTYLTTSVY